MRIIKHGNPKEHEYVCICCGCRFTYTRRDVTVKRYPTLGLAYWVYCPDCGTPYDVLHKRRKHVQRNGLLSKIINWVKSWK